MCHLSHAKRPSAPGSLQKCGVFLGKRRKVRWPWGRLRSAKRGCLGVTGRRVHACERGCPRAKLTQRMGLSSKTVIVVPCFNEAARLNCAAFENALKVDPMLEFIFVNDGSTDNTIDVLNQLEGQVGDRARVLELKRNSGKAEAVRVGVLRAFEQDAKYIGYWDADLATPLTAIELFAKELEVREVSLVLGSRVRLMGRHISRSPIRHYIGRGFATLAAVALGFPVYDTQCGAKLFRASPVFRAAFSDKFETTWTFDVELLQRLHSPRARAEGFQLEQQCVEYPLPEWVDTPGSKLNPRQYPRILRDMAVLAINGFAANWRQKP